MIEKCPDCDRVLATDSDNKVYPPGGGEHLCWRNFANDTCEGEPVDWRARCLASEAKDGKGIRVHAKYEREHWWADTANHHMGLNATLIPDEEKNV